MFVRVDYDSGYVDKSVFKLGSYMHYLQRELEETISGQRIRERAKHGEGSIGARGASLRAREPESYLYLHASVPARTSHQWNT